MIGFEENEVSKNANGGTEITKRLVAKFVPEKLANEFQIIPSRVREINEEKIRIYWQHDLAEDPEVKHLSDQNSFNRFHKLVFSSNWQLQEFNTRLGIPLSDSISVIETPIEPIEFTPKSKDVVNLIYFSTPQRGLELLIPSFKALSEKYDNIHLHVFSSFKIYGWDDADKSFEPLYQQVRDHPKMTYHGYSEQSVLRKHLQEAHILAYPNIWTETSCRVLMESMSAGLMCVHPNYGALPDTSGGLTSMYQFDQDPNKHANMFTNYLEHAINVVNQDNAQNYLKFVKAYADTRFNISRISSQWENMLNILLEKYPTAESRKIPSNMFVYRT